jgi:adenine phosphoribosyltransferase
MMEKFWNVRLGPDLDLDLPLVHVDGDFYIYLFDMMGQRLWNQAAARSLVGRLKDASAEFDILLTAEAKAIGLTEEMAGILGHDEYVVLRKSLKVYMHNPAVVDVKSITTESLQHFYLAEQRFPALVGKRVCVVDDVVSTGGTLAAFFQLAEQIGFQIAYIACALTEGERRDSFNGAPVFALDHIPLPR